MHTLIIPPSLQLLDITGTLIERPLVAQDMSHKYLALIRMFSTELDAVRVIYSQHIREETEHGRVVARGMGGVCSVTGMGRRYSSFI